MERGKTKQYSKVPYGPLYVINSFCGKREVIYMNNMSKGTESNVEAVQLFSRIKQSMFSSPVCKIFHVPNYRKHRSRRASEGKSQQNVRVQIIMSPQVAVSLTEACVSELRGSVY